MRVRAWRFLSLAALRRSTTACRWGGARTAVAGAGGAVAGAGGFGNGVRAVNDQPFRGRPIQTSERAQSIAELASDRFKIVGFKSHIWNYSIPVSEVAPMQAARNEGRIITAQGQFDGHPVLYAKLVA